MEYPFGQLGSAVPAVSPPSFLCPPRVYSLVGRCEEQKRPWALSNNWKPQCALTLFPSHIQNTALHQLLAKKVNSIPTETTTLGKQPNTCLTMGSSEWIPYFALLVHEAFCFTCLTVLISAHKFFSLLPSWFSPPSHCRGVSDRLRGASLPAGVKLQQTQTKTLFMRILSRTLMFYMF